MTSGTGRIADILLGALVKELEADGTFEGMCVTTVMPGGMVPMDYFDSDDCSGMVWVRLVSANPTVTFPNPTAQLNTCAATLALPFEIGVMRSSSVAQTFGTETDLPDDETLRGEAEAQYMDMEAMYRALQNAMRHIPLAVVGSYAPVGPDAGANGGYWTVTAGWEL